MKEQVFIDFLTRYGYEIDVFDDEDGTHNIAFFGIGGYVGSVESRDEKHYQIEIDHPVNRTVLEVVSMFAWNPIDQMEAGQ